MNETPYPLNCKECGQGFLRLREYAIHFQSSHMGPRSLRNDARHNYNTPFPNSTLSSHAMLSDRPPTQPIMPQNNSSVTPRQRVPEAERPLHVQKSSTSTKWYLGQLDVPIKKTNEEDEGMDDEELAKFGLSRFDSSLKL